MRLSRSSVFLARLLFLVYALFTASYCLLAYIPFVYQQVHQGELLPWLTKLVRLHALLFWPALGVTLVTIVPDLRTGSARYLALGFAVTGVFVGIGLLIHPLLTGLSNDNSSLVWCLVSLIPLLWLAAIDLAHGRTVFTRPRGAEDGSMRTFLAMFQAAVYLAILNFTIAVLAIWNGRSLHFSPSQWAWSLLWSLVSHLLVFLFIFVLFDFVNSLAALLPEPQNRVVAVLGPILVVAALIFLILRYIIFPPLSFTGPSAYLVATVLSLSLVVFATGVSVQLWNWEGKSPDSGLDLLLIPLRFLNQATWKKRLLALTALSAFAWILSVRVARLDWEFLLRKMMVMFVWIIAFAVFYTVTPKVNPLRRTWTYAIAVVVLLFYLGLLATQPRRGLDDYSGYDISFQLVDGMLRSGNATRTVGSEDRFYAFLAEHTHIPRSTRLSPVDINLVSQLRPRSGRKPHIFFLVIDSLRRDFLSPYNAAVSFTPAIDALSRDSAVFKNAFTHYGGTGLSEPSIWVGGLMLHKQYITPFAPMNTLEKLVEVNDYREWISKDSVLQQVVPASPNIVELDEHKGTMYYDFCQTLEELTRRLASVGSSAKPVFVYTQPQNLHVSVIDRERRSVPPGTSFSPRFDAAYASRVQRMDRCLGEFLDTLKNSRMYDNSIIIVTSDHGDSLGERGRWGHAYTIFPEIVRIPLIVHLPAWLRGNVKCDPKMIAFLTDLTPTLYYLLGQKPIVNNELLGRPLFTVSLEEQKPYLRDYYLVVSSYAPVYGLLSENGRLLYIADGVNYRDYAYELSPDGSSSEVRPSDEQRAEWQKDIQQQVNAISRFYGLH